MSNLMKDMTKREMYVLVLVSGMLQDADASWLKMYGNNVIKSAELMADKIIGRVNEFAPKAIPPLMQEIVGEVPRPVTVEVARNDLGDQDFYEEEVVGTVETVTENLNESEEGGDANGQ